MLPEAIMTNDIMERLAFAQPQSLDDMKAIKGLGVEKFALYGAELLEFSGPTGLKPDTFFFHHRDTEEHGV